MAKITESLSSSIKNKVFGITKTKSVTKENPNTLIKVISKNFMALSGIARDLNVARQNIQKLVELEGGKPAKGADAFFLKEKERETKLEVEMTSKKPKKTAGKALAKGLIMLGLSKLLKIVFTSFIKVVQKYFTPIIIIGAIFIGFKDAFSEWATSLFDAIKIKFTEFTDNIKKWFQDSIQPIIDKAKELIQPIIDAVSGFITKIGSWLKEKFEMISEIFQNPLNFIKNIIDKVFVLIDGAKKALSNLTSGVKNFFGKKPKEAPVDDTAERAKLERQQKEALETERIKKLEKEKQYTGEDEIVRKRLDLPEKTETMRREAEAAKAPTPVEPAPPPEPIVVPGPMPAAAAPKEKAKPKAPSAAPAPTPSAPPGAQKSTAEPAKIPGGVPGLVVGALNDAGITSPKAHANVLATVKAESNFKPQSESLFYKTAKQIAGKFGKKRIPSEEFAQQFVSSTGDNRSELLANHVYKSTDGNSAPGDGFKYRGRGFIQHTGKNQYAAISKATGTDLVSNPDALNSPEVAAKAIAWFFLNYKRLKPEDMESISKVNKAVGFADDKAGTQAIAREASAQQIQASMSSGSGTQMAAASSDVASGQRQQQKPSTPIIVNAPTTNTTVISKNQAATPPPKTDSARSLAARVA